MITLFSRSKRAFSLSSAIFLGTILGAGLAQAQQTAAIHGGGGIVLPPPPLTPIIPVENSYRLQEESVCNQQPCPEEKLVTEKVTVLDNYQWLEDGHDPLVRKWIHAQINYTQLYLSQLKMRPEIANQLTALMNVETETVPVVEKDVYFFEKKLAGQEQKSIYMRKGLQGTDVLLVDASKLSKDQNTSVTIWGASQDAKLLVYGVRKGGADEETIHFRNVATGQDMADVLPRARYFGVSLAPKNAGLYYSIYNATGTHVFYHAFGTPESADNKVFGNTYKGRKLGPLDLVSARVSQDERYLVLHISHGVPATQDDILVKDLRHANSG